MEHFNSIVEKIKLRLSQDLPGYNAQDMMMPVGRSATERRILEDQEKEIRIAGVLILLFPMEDKICFPLTLRQDYEGIHSGQISLPGGRKEDQDKDILATALRETEEEIGVSVNDIQIIGTLSDLFIPPSRFRITPVVGYIPETPRFEVDPREVKELIVADLNHLTDKQFRKKKELRIRESYLIETPYFDIHGQVVWGATGMVLSEFAHIIEELDQML